MKKLIPFLFLFFLLSSCSVDVEVGGGTGLFSEATLSYILTTSTAPDSCESIRITLENVAIKTEAELFPNNVSIETGSYTLLPRIPFTEIDLGSAGVDAGTVEGFELTFNSLAFLTKNGLLTTVEFQQVGALDLPFFGEEIVAGDFATVTFELDMNRSRLVEENGVLKFYPEFNLQWD